MRLSEPLAAVTPFSICQELHQFAVRLQSLMRERLGDVGELRNLLELLESLPLSSSEYGRASSRLRHANRLLAAGECGAAQYELRTLFGSLRHLQTIAVEPCG